MGLFDSLSDLASSGIDAVTNPTKGGLIDSVENILDPGNVRKQLSGLFTGGASSNKGGKAAGTNIVGTGGKNPIHDWRVKVSLPAGSGISYGASNPLLNILNRTGGVVFPYTPSITVTHNARYSEQALTHSNYKNYFYEGSDVSAIQIAGDFTVQNKDDALYLLAAIFFFRSTTKMFFGQDPQDLAGNPPPIVYLDGYGDYYFPHVSCVVTSFQHTMPADVDYIEVSYSQGDNTLSTPVSVSGSSNSQIARIPITSQLNVTLQPIYSRQNIANNMSLTKFSQGALLKGKGGFL
jgi:hypothetical protein